MRETVSEAVRGREEGGNEGVKEGREGMKERCERGRAKW